MSRMRFRKSFESASLPRDSNEIIFERMPAFSFRVMGCKVRDPVIRSKFLATFDKSLATGLFSRLHYLPARGGRSARCGRVRDPCRCRG
jgi:hypothetical protein